MAAGLGFKTFNTGDVLSAADTNGYLMQGVLVFTNATARDAAITSPQEGQFAFTKDNDSLWYYSGSAWVSSGATGDIEGVTAGVGISGGGTSGTVTVTNSMATAIDAKGDLVVGTGADTFSKLTVGANNTILTADSAEATGLKWAALASGGMTLISTTTANNDSSVVISSIPTTYKNLQLVIRNLRGSVDNQDVRMRINGDTGSVYREMTSSDGGQSFNATYLTIGNGSDTATSNGLCFVDIIDYTNTTTWKIAQATYVNNNGDTTTLLQFKNSSGLLTNLTSAVTSLTIFMASGNVTSGTFLLYGVQ